MVAKRLPTLDSPRFPFSIADCIQSVVELLAPRAHDKDLEIAWSIAPDVPRTLLGDEVRIRQILMNLVGNAIKFTERGGVTVKLEAQPVRDNCCRLKLTVTDTGIGIAPDAIVSIFGEFERADSGGGRNQAGTGLGLAIALRLARAMGGDIKVASAPGRGATFTVELDLAAATQDTGPWIQPRADIANVTAVLAFDHLLERRSMAAMLRDHGANVIEADDPQSATQVPELRTGERIVDMFVVSASEDPADAARALHDIRQRNQATQVNGFVLASPAERAQLADFRAVGFERHLVRPVRPKSLLTQLVAQARTAIGKEAVIEDCGSVGQSCGVPDREDAVRVLLAEDNDINALLTETMLSNCGCTTTRVHDGRAAVATVLKALEDGEPYDMVLMDLHMPEIDGIAATSQIREMCLERGSKVPVIVAVTANAFAEDRDRCLAAGMDDYLAKPFDRSELVEMVNRTGVSGI